MTMSAEADIAITELITLGQQLLADPEFDPYLPQLIDLRGLSVQHESGTADDLRQFVLSVYRPRVQSSIAVTIDESLDTESVAGLFHLSCAMDNTELFDHYDQAIKWLMRREFA